MVVTRLLGPAEAVAVTRQLRACGLLPPAPAAASVVVAASRSRGRVNKFFALDCGGGGGGGEALAVSRGGGRAAPAAPPGPHPLLRWLEAHAAAAEGGVFRAEALDPTAEAEAGAGSQAAPPPPRALTLFPRPHLPSPTSPAPHPLAARAVARVTRGVEVVASAVHLPEGSDGRRSAFGYRIRVRLLPLAAQGGGAQPPLASAQLLSRRWVVSHPAGSGAPDDAVEGPGVVGLTPLLLAGGPPFEYCSMTRVVRAPAPAAAGGGGGVGWMGGALVFVPGSGAHQAGEPFEAAVGPFPLEVGGYVW